MIDLRYALTLLAMLGTAGYLPQSQANPARCAWDFSGPIPMNYRRDSGTVHVPRDAPLGTVIGQLDGYAWTPTDGRRLTCYHFGDGSLIRLRIVSQVPIFAQPLPPIDGENSDGHILQTGIAGVGVRVRLEAPFDGRTSSSFEPEGGRTLVPFNTIKATSNRLGTVMGLINHRITFVKTGDIPPGSHTLNGLHLFSGIMELDGLGEVFKFFLSARIVQAECSIGANPVSPNPVNLLEWERSDFAGPGSATTTIPFTIHLQGCITDPGGNSRVTLQLDPTNGSQGHPTYPGVFSMGTGADAAGVGIQIVKSDGSPLPLGVEQDMLPVGTGNMSLQLGAHLFQTDPVITPGAAKGALNFTLRYR